MPCTQKHGRDLDQLLAEPTTTLSLREYWIMVADLPLPSPEQRENFIEFVSTAHSWYKHLPKYLPGAPFHFFLDRFSGYDLKILEDQTCVLLEREERGFHHSDIPTAEYRSRFGFLNYACAEGTAILPFHVGAAIVPRDKIVEIVRNDGVRCCLPQAVLEAGLAELTNVIYPCNWDPRIGGWTETPRIPNWPEASGGLERLEKILERCAELESPECIRQANEREREALQASRGLSGKERVARMRCAGMDPVLSALLEPERVRQRREMRNAIDRVCTLIQNFSREGGATAR